MKKHYLALVLILFVLPLFAQNIPNYVPKDGLVGYWPFNGNANDESGNGNHGTVNGPLPTKDRFYMNNQAYQFNGSPQYIDLGNKVLDANPNSYSYSVWTKLDSLYTGLFGTTSVILTKRHADIGVSWSTLQINKDTLISYNVDGPGFNVGLNGKNKCIDKQWYHIVTNKIGNKYQLFINSKLIMDTVINYNHFGSNLNMFVGHHGGWQTYYYGKIDDIAIYNRALTESEIQALYEGNACPLKAAISPQGSVKICEGSSIVLQSADSTYAYQWFKDNQPIAGATSKSYTATKAGQYTLKVSDPICSTTSQITTIDTIPLPAAPALSNTYQKVCQSEPIEIISKRLTNYNSAVRLRWYRNETGNDSINKYLVLEPYPNNYFLAQLSATSPQCESPKRTMVFMDVNMPVSVSAKGNTSFCQGDSVVLEVSAANGNQYDYAWKKDYNWIDGTEGKNTFVAKEPGRYSYQNRMCGMQMNGNEIEVFVKQGLTVNVGKITGSSVEFVWDTLSLSPTTKDFVINYGINSTSLTQTISIPVTTSYVFTGLNKGDTVRVSITPKGTDCTTPSFASAVATEIVLPNNIPTNGLVGYWPFNGNANDESGNGNHGTVSGALLIADRNGISNSAYSFDGVSNYISVPNSKSLNIIGNEITISFWLNNKKNDKNYKGISKGGWDVGEGYEFLYTEDLGLQLSGNYGGLQRTESKIGDRFLNNWVHLVATFKNGQGNFFINNQKISASLNGNQFTNFKNTELPLIFGKRSDQNIYYKGHVLGYMDDIAIYNRALSEQEIKQLYGVGCTKEKAISSSFSYPALTTSLPISLNAEPQGGAFSGVAVEKNQFIPSKAKIGLNKVQYNFKNSQGCNDSSLFSMIVADTVGTKCTKIDTITVKNNVYDTVTITNNVTKYDTVKVTKFDTITVKNNVYDTVKITKYDTVTITNNVTKYDTITLTDTVSILKITFKLTTGIQANQMASMSLYPNPTTDVLHIEVGDAKALDGYRYRILDALGKEVYNELVKNAITEIPLKTIGAAGMYQFEVLDEQNVRIQANKIILQ